MMTALQTSVERDDVDDGCEYRVLSDIETDAGFAEWMDWVMTI